MILKSELHTVIFNIKYIFVIDNNSDVMLL